MCEDKREQKIQRQLEQYTYVAKRSTDPKLLESLEKIGKMPESQESISQGMPEPQESIPQENKEGGMSYS